MGAGGSSCLFPEEISAKRSILALGPWLARAGEKLGGKPLQVIDRSVDIDQLFLKDPAGADGLFSERGLFLTPERASGKEGYGKNRGGKAPSGLHTNPLLKFILFPDSSSA